MTWFRVDDNLTDHPKVLALGKDMLPAMGLWSLLGAWCGRYDTEGFVRLEIVRRHDSRLRLARRLVEVGLWERVVLAGNEGFQYHDWDHLQPSPEEIERKKELNRERQARHRKRRAGIDPQGPGPGETVDDDVVSAQPDESGTTVTAPSRNGRRNALQNALVTQPRPDPARPVTTGGALGGGRPVPNADAGATPEEPTRCSLHAALPAGSDIPPCGVCARLARTHREQVAQAARRQVAARAQLADIAAACQASGRCDEYGWELGGDGLPAHPARRCDHGLRAVADTG